MVCEVGDMGGPSCFCVERGVWGGVSKWDTWGRGGFGKLIRMQGRYRRGKTSRGAR